MCYNVVWSGFKWLWKNVQPVEFSPCCSLLCRSKTARWFSRAVLAQVKVPLHPVVRIAHLTLCKSCSEISSCAKWWTWHHSLHCWCTCWPGQAGHAFSWCRQHHKKTRDCLVLSRFAWHLCLDCGRWTAERVRSGTCAIGPALTCSKPAEKLTKLALFVF